MNAEQFADDLALHMEKLPRPGPDVDCGTHPTEVISEDEARFVAVVAVHGEQNERWTVTLKRGRDGA